MRRPNSPSEIISLLAIISCRILLKLQLAAPIVWFVEEPVQLSERSIMGIFLCPMDARAEGGFSQTSLIYSARLINSSALALIHAFHGGSVLSRKPSTWFWNASKLFSAPAQSGGVSSRSLPA